MAKIYPPKIRMPLMADIFPKSTEAKICPPSQNNIEAMNSHKDIIHLAEGLKLGKIYAHLVVEGEF